MTIDWDADHLAPIYEALGVEATLSLLPSDTVTVIDKTAGVEVFDKNRVGTLRPAADVRMAELTEKGVDRDDLTGTTVTFNEVAWKITSTRPMPTPSGEASGELRLILAKPSA